MQSLKYKLSMNMKCLTCLMISVTFKVKHLPREEYGNVFPESAYLKDTFIGLYQLPEFNDIQEINKSNLLLPPTCGTVHIKYLSSRRLGMYFSTRISGILATWHLTNLTRISFHITIQKPVPS